MNLVKADFVWIALLSFFLSLSSCYSFKGISIPPEVNTFVVREFTDRSISIAPGLAQDFSQRLRDKIRDQSPLEELANNQKSDLEFSGYITDYRVDAIAPLENQGSASNQLTIAVKVVTKFANMDLKENEYNRSFNFAAQFPSSQNLFDVQDELVDIIFDQITEDIFNFTFTNW